MSPWLLFVPALAVVAGLELYLGLAVIALAGSVEWLASPPGALGDLASGWVVLPALGLYLAEALSELRPSSAFLWHAVQAPVRPLAAALLGLLLAESAGPATAVAAAVLVGAGAWLVHGVVWGRDLRRWLLERRGVAPLLRSGGHDAAAAGLLVLALDFPRIGAIGAAAALFLLLAVAGWPTRLSRFGVRLAWDAAWSLAGRAGWRNAERLPAWTLAGPGPDDEAAQPGARGCRVGAFDLGSAGRFRAGWLIVTDERCRFRYRRAGGEGTEELGTALSATVERAGLFDRLRLNVPDARDEAVDDGSGDDGPDAEGSSAPAGPRLVLSKRSPEPELVRDAIARSRRRDPPKRTGNSGGSSPRNPAASPG